MARVVVSLFAVVVFVVGSTSLSTVASAQTSSPTLTVGNPPVDVRAGTEQIVLVSVRSGDQSVAGIDVTWDVFEGNNRPQAGVVRSNDVGIARIAVDTSRLVPAGGTDELRAWIDVDANGRLDAGEPLQQVTLRTLPSENRAPVAVPQNVSIGANSSVDITLEGSDPDGQRIGYSITRMPSHGSVPAFLAGPFLTYTPVDGYVGEDSFDFGVTDASGLTTTATVSIQVTSPAELPTCEGKTATIVAQPGQKVIIGTDGDDVIVGSSNEEWIYGLGGNDTICGNGGNDILFGGSGDDLIVLSGNGGVVYGGDGADVIHARGVDGWLFGGNGNDTMYGGGPVNNFYGSDGDDNISVGAGPSIVSGGNGNDTLRTTGNATLWGGEGLDHLIWPDRQRHD